MMTAFLAYILSQFSWCTLYTVGRAGITVQYAERTTECREYEGVCRCRDLRPRPEVFVIEFRRCKNQTIISS